MYSSYQPQKMNFPFYLFFTGKGGVGKTSIACATALALADEGKKILLISTDPASNLQDVFEVELTMKPTAIPNVKNLFAINLDPEKAAEEYRENIVGPYRDKFPTAVIQQMEEQMSGACTVEIAAFDQFSHFLTDEEFSEQFDHVIFDTAPTGHTLRLLELPSAWNDFMEESTHGVSCLGPLAKLANKKVLYEKAVTALADREKTLLLLVSRADKSPLEEATRAAKELGEIGVENQVLLINGLLPNITAEDEISIAFYERQQTALANLPVYLQNIATYGVALAPFNVTGINSLRQLFSEKLPPVTTNSKEVLHEPTLKTVVDNICESGKKVIFTMGKGGVGKTTIASAIAISLVERGKKVHLTTTDPAAHLEYILSEEMGNTNFTISKIDPKAEVEKYRQSVIEQTEHMLDEDGLAYLEEDLRSPCTEEIAVFRAFANIVERAEEEIVVIDTAPTGHTLLLLDAAHAYHKEIQRSSGEVPISVQKLLPRLRNKEETSVVIVTLAETTPVHEASRLQVDLARAGITPDWWVINQSLSVTNTKDEILYGRAMSELEWIERVKEKSNGHYALIGWKADELVGYEKLKKLVE